MPNLRCLTIIPSIYSNRTVDVLEATDGWSWSLARRGSGYIARVLNIPEI